MFIYLLLSFFSFSLLSNAATEFQHPKELSCSELFQSLFPAESNEWIRISVRDPKSTLLDPAYLTRLNLSMSEVFVPWFENPSDLSFKEMLRNQHLVATTNEKGEAFYFGVSLNGKRAPVIIQPGLYLFEFKNIPTPDRWGSLWRNPSEYFASNSASLIEVYKRIQFEKQKFTNTNSMDTLIYSIQLPGISPTISVENHVKLENPLILHRYIKYEDVPKVLKHLDNFFAELRKSVKAKDKNTVLDLLAQYTFIFSNSHFFRGANFSIAMAHVNWILNRIGLRGISHYDLDYSSFYIDYEVFKEIFIQHIRSENVGKI